AHDEGSRVRRSSCRGPGPDRRGLSRWDPDPVCGAHPGSAPHDGAASAVSAAVSLSTSAAGLAAEHLLGCGGLRTVGVVDLAVVRVGSDIATSVRLLALEGLAELRLELLRCALTLGHPLLLRLPDPAGRFVHWLVDCLVLDCLVSDCLVNSTSSAPLVSWSLGVRRRRQAPAPSVLPPKHLSRWLRKTFTSGEIWAIGPTADRSDTGWKRSQERGGQRRAQSTSECRAMISCRPGPTPMADTRAPMSSSTRRM